MSNPKDEPPREPGAHDESGKSEPPAEGGLPPVPPRSGGPVTPPPVPEGYDGAPRGYQQPPGYPVPGQQPQYQSGGPAAAGGIRFEMPKDRPRSFSDAMPAGGLSGMFTVTAMPTELRVSYWIWLIGGLLGLLAGIIGVFGSFVLFAFAPGAGLVVLLLVLAGTAIAAAQIVLAMKMKEGREWARFALTIVAGISLVLVLINAAANGRGGGSWTSFLISLAATVLMWLPNAQAWFTAQRIRP